MKHTIDTAVLQKTLNYLATRPYAEVADLVQGIQQSAVQVADVQSQTTAPEAPVESAIPTADVEPTPVTPIATAE